jgi:hypothetical protein
MVIQAELLDVDSLARMSTPWRSLVCSVFSITGSVHHRFPNSFSPTASQSLGYAAAMLEASLPVVYVYIADAHDNRTPWGTFGQ